MKKKSAIYLMAAYLATAAVIMTSIGAMAADDAANKATTEAAAENKENKDDAKGAAQNGDTAAAPAKEAKPEDAAAASTGEPAPAKEQKAPPQEVLDPSTSMAEALNRQRTMVADDDIMMIRIGYQFGDGSFDEWQRGTGFVVGNRYIITRQILADLSTQNTLYQRILKERGESYNRIGVNLSNEAETQAHMTCFVTDTEGKDITIHDITLKSGLALIVTNEVMERPAVVFADANKVDLGDGAIVNIKSVGNADDRCVVNTFQGRIVTKEDQESGYSFKAEGDMANPIGSPVYDKNGHILGMVSGDGDPLSCFTIKSLETFLTTNGVAFRTIEQIEAEGDIYDQKNSEEDINEAESVVSNKEELEAIIEKAQAAREEDYTSETYSPMKEALEEAIRVDANLETTQEQVDAATNKLTESYNALETKGFFRSILRKLGSMNSKTATIPAVLLALIISAVIIFKKVLPEAKLKKGGFGKPEDGMAAKKDERKKEPDEIVNDDDIDITKRPKGKKKRKPGDYDPGIDYVDEEDRMEVLNDDDGSDDTLVLKKEAYLVRKENGKMVPIIKNNFTIGKERKKVDYCISGNPTVSRHHCTIRMIEDRYYVEDNDSANYTYINGKRIKPYSNAHIENGDEITLSNVEFVFHTK